MCPCEILLEWTALSLIFVDLIDVMLYIVRYVPNDQNKQELIQGDVMNLGRIIEKFGIYFAEVGLSKTYGRLFGFFMTTTQPTSISSLSILMAMSKLSITKMANTLNIIPIWYDA